MAQSLRPLPARDDSEIAVWDTLKKYYTTDGLPNRRALAQDSTGVNYSTSNPEQLEVKGAITDARAHPPSKVDFSFKFTRDSSGAITRIDVTSGLSGIDSLARFRRSIGIDQGEYFTASYDFDAKAGTAGTECRLTHAEGDSRFDFEYCRKVETVMQSQQACNKTCAAGLLAEFRRPTLITPLDYDPIEHRAEDEKDYRKLAGHVFLDTCQHVYPVFLEKAAGTAKGAMDRNLPTNGAPGSH